MITKNFKAIVATILSTSGGSTSPSLIPVTQTNGTTAYLNFHCYFPSTKTYSVSISSSVQNAGIRVGTGNTPPSENDYYLESAISSGLTASSVSETRGEDNNGNYYVEYTFMLTNTTSNDITVSEIGYLQNVKGNITKGSISESTLVLLLDRTVLSTPITVPANDSVAIKYRLASSLS